MTALTGQLLAATSFAGFRKGGVKESGQIQAILTPLAELTAITASFSFSSGCSTLLEVTLFVGHSQAVMTVRIDLIFGKSSKMLFCDFGFCDAQEKYLSLN